MEMTFALFVIGDEFLWRQNGQRGRPLVYSLFIGYW